MLLFLSVAVSASKLEKGFEALWKNDYFKAKKIFSEINSKKPNPYSAFGLATIYSRSDNPFFNSDSAAKYASQSYNLLKIKQKPVKIKALQLDSSAVLVLADSIAERQLQKIKSQGTVQAYNKFLLANYIANQTILIEAAYLRDELEFNRMIEINKSDSTLAYVLTHPQSNFLIEAVLLSERQIFDEITIDKSAESYKMFLKKYPQNTLKNAAYEKLFEIYRLQSNAVGLKYFVRAYPNAPQNLDAWKLLFSLTVKSYSNTDLKKFIDAYPDFPLKNTIIKELELNNITLFPYQQKELSGFVNAEGKLVIPAIYYTVSDFYEGLSVVNKNDTVFFINKENVNPFNKFFTDAYPFKNGIAAVKQKNKWFFINRLGQPVSKLYDEINEPSNNAYVIKLNEKYGAVDLFAQTIIEPKFYKLGDFKNDFAYYMIDNKYGFVSKSGIQHKAEFEWISDFNNKHVAVMKTGSKFGLVNGAGKIILEAEYDQVIKTETPLFIVVSNMNYGFFSSEGCFLSTVSYDYSKEKPAEFYTNGEYLKLITKGEQSLIDKNGRTLVSFDAYSEISFFADGLMKVRKDLKKEIRFGYLDKKNNLAIPPKYQQATDFSDSVAIVKLKNKFVMLNTAGEEIFTSEHPIEKLSAHYYLMNDGFNQVLDHKGKIVFADIQSAQILNPWLLVVTLSNGEIKLLYD